MGILSLEDTSDRLAGVTERLHLADDLVHSLDLVCSLLTDLVLRNLIEICCDLEFDTVSDFLVLDEFLVQSIELVRILLVYCLTYITEAVAAYLCKMDDFLLCLCD